MRLPCVCFAFALRLQCVCHATAPRRRCLDALGVAVVALSATPRHSDILRGIGCKYDDRRDCATAARAPILVGAAERYVTPPSPSPPTPQPTCLARRSARIITQGRHQDSNKRDPSTCDRASAAIPTPIISYVSCAPRRGAEGEQVPRRPANDARVAPDLSAVQLRRLRTWLVASSPLLVAGCQ